MIEYIFKVRPSAYQSFEHILKESQVTHYEEKKLAQSVFKTKLFSEAKNIEEREVVLYYNANSLLFPEQLSQFLRTKKLKIIKNPHPSLLINSLSHLDDSTLDKLKIPHRMNHVSLLLPLHKKEWLGYPASVFSIDLSNQHKKVLTTHTVDTLYDETKLLLLEKSS